MNISLPTEPNLTPVFAGICPCGGWIAVIVDTPEHAARNAKEVSRLMRQGFRIDKITVDDVRTGRAVMCECERRKKKPAQRELPK
jgi:hypothetical protein